MNIPLVTNRAIKTAKKSIYRNKWTALMTFFALTLVFLLVHITSALLASSEEIINNLQKKVDIGVFFIEDSDEDDLKMFLSRLDEKKIKGEIKDYTFFSQEEGLQEFEKKYPSRMVFLKHYDIANPLLAMVEIVPNSNKLEELRSFLRREEFSDIIHQDLLIKSKSEEERVSNFLKMANFAENSGGAIFVFFLLIATGLLFHAIAIATKSREKEIQIMKLVGAEFFHIRLPFIIEGIILAFSAFLLSLGIAFFLFFIFSQFVQNIFPDPALQKDIMDFTSRLADNMSIDVIRNAFIVLLVALISSFLATEKYLRKV